MKPSIGSRSKDILKALMDPSPGDAVPWSNGELRAILEHQLSTPVPTEIDLLGKASEFDKQIISQTVDSLKGATFAEVLTSESPSLSVLHLIKDFAKSAMSDPDGLPRDVGRVIYVLAILRGQHKRGKPLTTLDKGSVEREARRCLSFTWLPELLRALIRQGLDRRR